MTPAALRVPLLLVVGVVTVAGFRQTHSEAFDPALAAQLLMLPVVLALEFITPLRRASVATIDWLRLPSPARRRVTALLIGILAFFYLLASARLHGRDLTPRLQDEFSYLVQAQLLARGKLWIPSPPLADFLETFHVVVKPV